MFIPVELFIRGDNATISGALANSTTLNSTDCTAANSINDSNVSSSACVPRGGVSTGLVRLCILFALLVMALGMFHFLRFLPLELTFCCVALVVFFVLYCMYRCKHPRKTLKRSKSSSDTRDPPPPYEVATAPQDNATLPAYTSTVQQPAAAVTAPLRSFDLVYQVGTERCGQIL